LRDMCSPLSYCPLCEKYCDRTGKSNHRVTAQPGSNGGD
jgi:hypothetical protein